MYKVIKEFTDLQDENHFYKVGDVYPREGSSASESRINQLAGKTNRQGVPLIAEEKDVKDVSDETLNPATPVQSEVAEQEPPSFMNPPEDKEEELKIADAMEEKVEKPKRGRRSKEY